MNTSEKLERLAQLQAKFDTIRLNFDELRNSILTPEIRAQLAEIDAEQQYSEMMANASIAELTDEIKAEVLAIGASIRGGNYQAVLSKGRVSWDTKSLDGYAAAHPEILPFRKETSPSVSIRVIK